MIRKPSFKIHWPVLIVTFIVFFVLAFSLVEGAGTAKPPDYTIGATQWRLTKDPYTRTCYTVFGSKQKGDWYDWDIVREVPCQE